MKMYWVKTNWIIKKIFPNYIWNIKTTQNKTVYLTFDDGPTPEITDWTLDLLTKYNAKATFFSIGENINKYPEIFQRIIIEGHSVGNHTFNHLNGWKTSHEKYLENVAFCSEEISKYNQPPQLLFRPPYGKIKNKQAKVLKDKGYKIIMWDVLSADFDQTITPDQCLENVLKNIANGSIVIFHDSVKASKNLKYVLPKVLQYLQDKKYDCKGI